MKVIIEKGIVYKITGERGDFTITEDVKGKPKMFQTSTISIVESEFEKVKIYKKSTHQSEANSRHIAYEKQQLNDAKYSRGIYKHQ
jgi:hypothetical protein